MTEKTFYITTPIYYVNDNPHLGHIYTTVACDVLARHKRLDGYKVKFLTGTDDHGQKVHKAASAKGLAPQTFTDQVSQNFRDLIKTMHYSNDDFIRTTEERHIKAAQHLWSTLETNGHIYKDSYAGWYALRDEAYYTEDELTDGPDGKKIAPSGAECEWMEEESYFFKLSQWAEKLLELYDSNPEFVQPVSKLNEVKSFVQGGLKDLSISRTKFDWGVPVPGDEKHVMYVWIDALTNYITALGYPDTSGEFADFWPADIHMVGKDILRFHAVYWPAFLMAADLPVPKQVFAHGWWTIEGQKMSKSLGNVIAPEDLVKRYGVDPARYFMLREVPFGNDGDFSHTQAVQRINSDLANGIGNLAQRSLSMIYKNCDGAIPDYNYDSDNKLKTESETLLDDARNHLIIEMRRNLDACKFNDALKAFNAVVSEADAYIDTFAPWTLKKDDPDKMKSVLYTLAETIRALAIVIQPFTPESANKLLSQLEVPEDQRDFQHLDAAYALKPGTTIDKPEGVFPRIDVESEAA